MPTVKRTQPDPEVIDSDDGLTADSAVKLMRTNPGPETTDAEEDEQTLLEKMQALLADTPADKVRIKLYRVPKPGAIDRRFLWCQDYTPDEFADSDLEGIRAKWGPGDYQLRLIGSRGVVKAQTVSIAAPSTPAASTGQPSEIAQAIAMLAENQARMLEALTHRPDPQASMRETLTLMTLMRDAMGINTQNAAPAAAAPNPMEMMREVFSMVREAKSAAKELASEEGGEPAPTDPLAMLPKLLDLVGGAMKQGAAQPAQMLPPLQIPQTVAAAPMPSVNTDPSIQNNLVSSPQTQSQPVKQMTAEQIMIMGNIDTLCRMADAGIDPQKGGEYIADNLPDDLLDHLEHPQWFELVSGIFPQLKPREQWIRAAKEHADKLLAADGADDDQQSGAPSNPPA